MAPKESLDTEDMSHWEDMKYHAVVSVLMMQPLFNPQTVSQEW